MREDQELENAFNEITGGEPFPSRDPEMPPDATQRVNINRAAAGAPGSLPPIPKGTPAVPPLPARPADSPSAELPEAAKKPPKRRNFPCPLSSTIR